MYISCYESLGGEIMRWVGVALAIAPLLMLIMLSLYSGGLPLLKMYASSVLKSIGIVVLTVLVSAPAIYMSISLETKIYLQSCIVNAFTCGTCWLVVAEKILITYQNEKEKDSKSMLRVERKQQLEGIDSEENEQAAK